MHRHLAEIEQEISLAAGSDTVVQFTPHLIPVNRGILTTMSVAPTQQAAGQDGLKLIERSLREAYQSEPFVRLLGQESLPDTKHVVGTNQIEIAWRLDARSGRLMLMSAEDNLLKGAGGQAVQSLNILRGFPETMGLLF
jgi:N-acetyl-gamma-glutamyl-phosphate reductase